jgi:hypothetical protein
MKTDVNLENDYSLHNLNNFNKTFDVDINNDIMNRYIKLVIEYLKFIFENIKIQNLTHSKFIIIRGLETITNVFNVILYYTKNIDITYFQSQKSFYYYIEFIGQITEEQHTFLHLSSRDATIYVYKKTFYEINNDFRKNILKPTNEIIEKFDLINEYIKIYKIILFKIINYESKFNLERINIFEIFCNKLNNLKMVNIENIENIENIYNLELIINIFDKKINNIDTFFEIILLYLNKINKKINKIKKNKEKLYSDDFELYIKEPSNKFITWFIS